MFSDESYLTETTRQISFKDTSKENLIAEVKMELLAKASADAKTRAETIAKNAGNSIGKLKKATMGVFQINGLRCNDATMKNYGSYQKKITFAPHFSKKINQ